MRKILVVMLLALLLASPVFARSGGRARTSNIYQESFEVDWVVKTVSIPVNSIDITIRNDDGANDIWIDLQGGSGVDSSELDTEGAFLLPYGEQITINDFNSDTITMYSYDGAASPVSVIVTY